MHANDIIQNLLDTECPSIHMKRRRSLGLAGRAASKGKLTLMGISRRLESDTSLRHKIKMCDRMLSNPNLQLEAPVVYGGLSRAVLQGIKHPTVLVDWSDLTADRSLQILRASLVVKGRSLTLYEEVHPQSNSGSPEVHRDFMTKFKELLPPGCEPVIVSDAGFRSPWFKMLDELGFLWVGRIRNTDMVRKAASDQPWQGCKTLYALATPTAQDMGEWDYVRQGGGIRCRLVLYKKLPLGRHKKTIMGKAARNKRSLKFAKGQKEPWLLAASLRLKKISAAKVVAVYKGRMQTEEAFRDTKNPRWGLGLSESETKKPRRFAILLLIGALAIYALWVIGLAMLQSGRGISYGSKEKAKTTLSVLSLARWWLEAMPKLTLGRKRVNLALDSLCGLILQVRF